jgi:parvulin-like peptidyl-prolyl isomerase
MQVTKLRGAADVNGLIPAGQFFAQLAAKLEDANFEAALREAQLDEEDRALEAAYRKRSAARGGYAEREQHAMM